MVISVYLAKEQIIGADVKGRTDPDQVKLIKGYCQKTSLCQSKK